MPRPLLISGCAIVAGDEFLERGDLLIEGGKVRRIARRIPAKGAEVLRASGLMASPGLIDTQINGGFGHSFSATTPEQVAEVGRKLLGQGVTSYLPTVISLPRGVTLHALKNLVAASKMKGGAEILGIHMEGPFLSPERNGAHRLNHIRLPSVSEFKEYVKAAAGLLRMMTLAPERPGAMAVIKAGTRQGIIMSAGHSEATAAQVSRAVIDGGLRHVTHVYNAMSPLHHREETILNAALLIDRLSCGVIYDRDHISVGAAILLLKAKPRGKIVLVSDTTAGMGMPDGDLEADGEVYTVRKGQIRVKKNGRLAGSASSLLDCVRRFTADTGVPPHIALEMATAAPARLLGMEGTKGVLRPGADADIILLEKGLKVRMAFVRGELLYGNHH